MGTLLFLLYRGIVVEAFGIVKEAFDCAKSVSQIHEDDKTAMVVVYMLVDRRQGRRRS